MYSVKGTGSKKKKKCKPQNVDINMGSKCSPTMKAQKKKKLQNNLFMKESIDHRVEIVMILPKRDSKYLYYVDFFETQNLNVMKTSTL